MKLCVFLLTSRSALNSSQYEMYLSDLSVRFASGPALFLRICGFMCRIGELDNIHVCILLFAVFGMANIPQCRRRKVRSATDSYTEKSLCVESPTFRGSLYSKNGKACSKDATGMFRL